MCILGIVLSDMLITYKLLKVLILILIILYFIPVIFVLVISIGIMIFDGKTSPYIVHHFKTFSKQEFLLFPFIGKGNNVYGGAGETITIPAILVDDDVCVISLSCFNILKSAKLSDDIRSDHIVTYDKNVNDIKLDKDEAMLKIYVSKKASIYTKLKLAA